MAKTRRLVRREEVIEMRRRTFLSVFGGAALAPAFVAQAAGESAKPFRLGVLLKLPPGPGYRAFVQQLQVLGWEEGRNLRIDFEQLGDADPDRIRTLAAGLVGRGANVIYAAGSEDELKSAMAATSTIPIVFIANDYDPLAKGYIASLARPGGNVTGVLLQQVELTTKQLELLTRTVPELARVFVLWDRISADQFKGAREAARFLKIPLEGVDCGNPPYDYERALAGVAGESRDVLLQMSSPWFFQDRQRIPAAALGHRLPSMFAVRQWVDAGGLMSYGPSLTDMNRLAAGYVDRIAKGAKPADLPVQQPTTFELVINLKTAKALDLTVPQSLLASANEVIE
jgi:putative ABC transport system substrate-binding protein